MADVLEIPRSARRQAAADLRRLELYCARLKQVKALYRAHYMREPLFKWLERK